ncbi:DUF6479 family protein [Streptomyces sp. NPDC088719]|uniref:DUF6479 family protein n=1 Tax=Streptomyces sp. NPDC088719 TaxID=3365872 RepID=UPI0037F36CFC
MPMWLGNEHADGISIAAKEWAGGTVPFIVGLVVVALLIGSVIWRSRRGRSRPPRPEEQPVRPTTPPSIPRGDGRAADDFGAEGERLSPHQMKGNGNQGRSSRSGDDRSAGHGG